jgi:hypothetical protein
MPNEVTEDFKYLPFGGGRRKCIGESPSRRAGVAPDQPMPAGIRATCMWSHRKGALVSSGWGHYFSLRAGMRLTCGCHPLAAPIRRRPVCAV